MADWPTIPAGQGYPLVDADTGAFVSTKVNEALRGTIDAGVEASPYLPKTYAKRLRRMDLQTWSKRVGYIHPEPSSTSLSTHNAATSVTSPIVIGLDDPRVYASPRVYEGTTVAQATTTDYSGAVVSDGFENNNNAGAETIPWALEWVTDSERMELVYQATANVALKVFEDGMPHTLDAVVISNGGGGLYRYRIIPTSGRRLRHFRVEMTTMFPAQLVVSRADTVYAPPINRPRVGFVMDSYGQQGGLTSIPWRTSDLLGWEPIVDGDGGSGYLIAPTFRSRLTAILATDPDALVIAGGINDGTTGLATEIDTYFDAIVAARPDMPVFVCGPWAASDTSRVSQAGKFATIQAAAEDHGFIFLDNFTVPWITGTGTIAAPTGDGNADWMSASDGTHASPDGRRYLATRLAESLTDNIPSL